MSIDDNDSEIIFGDLGGLKLPDICLTGQENPRKNLTQETYPDRGSNPGPLRDKRACYHEWVFWLDFLYITNLLVQMSFSLYWSLVYRYSYIWYRPILGEKFVSKLGSEPQISSLTHWRSTIEPLETYIPTWKQTFLPYIFQPKTFSFSTWLRQKENACNVRKCAHSSYAVNKRLHCKNGFSILLTKKHNYASNSQTVLPMSNCIR